MGGYVTVHEHWSALREMDRRLADERDRRYSEVAQERTRALAIKETADLAALTLARDIQTYKDERANALRSQIDSERGLYVTHIELGAMLAKVEAVIAPLATWSAGQQGRSSGLSAGWGYLIGAVGLAAGALGLISVLGG